MNTRGERVVSDRPRVFFSYARADDQHSQARITAFRQALAEALYSVSGRPILVFQDREIRVGEEWRGRIDDELDSCSLLVAILTPIFFNRAECRREVKKFLTRERKVGRQGLVIPVHWINVPGLVDGDSAARDKDELILELSRRQCPDWCELRYESPPWSRDMHALASTMWNLLLELDSKDRQMLHLDRLPQLQAIPIREVLQAWTTPSLIPEDERRPLFIVVGGSYKYDEGGRKLLRMKGDQSTEPTKGVVRVARALDRVDASVLVDAVPDYDGELQEVRSREIDVVIVGGGDTNKLARRLFMKRDEAEIESLPIQFEPPTSSESIIHRGGQRPLDKSWHGLILALNQPLSGVRYALLCAGNGAQGTNAALSVLSDWLHLDVDQLDTLGADAGVLVEAAPDGSTIILWSGS